MGDGLLLAACAENVVAFAAAAPGAGPAAPAAGPPTHPSRAPYPAPAHVRQRYIAGIALGILAVVVGLGWLLGRRIRRVRVWYRS